MVETSVLEQISMINDDLAKLAADFDADLLTGKQAQRVVCAAADIERSALVLKTLAMRRVDETAAWRSDGARSPAKWLADKTGTSISDAHGTVELGEQLEHLPQVADAARRGQLSPLKTKIIANAASQDPASEEELLKTARQGTTSALRTECAAAVPAPGAMAHIHARLSHRAPERTLTRSGPSQHLGLAALACRAPVLVSQLQIRFLAPTPDAHARETTRRSAFEQPRGTGFVRSS